MGARREVYDPFMAPQGNLGPGSAALALRGWRPREIKPPRSLGVQLAQRLSALFGRLALWHKRAYTRQALLSLDDRALRDIGLDRAAAHWQASLPFWRGE
jgi:uncharacterized protein YjiS (DUF1127 family)